VSTTDNNIVAIVVIVAVDVVVVIVVVVIHSKQVSIFFSPDRLTGGNEIELRCSSAVIPNRVNSTGWTQTLLANNTILYYR